MSKRQDGAPVYLRLEEHLHDGLKKAVEAEAERTALKVTYASFVRKLVIDYLRENGFLTEKAKPRNSGAQEGTPVKKPKPLKNDKQKSASLF
jgi:hypothetical protein